MQEKIRLGISTCLLGEKVRYDGGHKLDHYLKETLGRYVEWVPVCPEVDMGLTVPREPMRLVGDPASPRLITIRSGVDHTDRMIRWADAQLQALSRMDLQGFIFKSRSPSSGMKGVKVYGGSGVPSRTGVGIFAREFMNRFPLLPIGAYHRGLIPLIVPVTLLGHYVRKHGEPYLKRQHYLNPHPLELMLRNHV